MFMIDGSLTFQFFSRHNLSIYEGDHETEYNYIKDYEYEVNKYSYNDDNYKYINFFYRNPHFLKNTEKMKEANEGTFLTFYKNFLSKRKKVPLAQTLYMLNLNPLEIYSQLISVIKGSCSSHLFINNCLSKEDYKTKGKKITDLPNLEDIYDVCMLYEEYKKQNKYFDIQDVVNFLIRQVKLEFKNVKLIDYLFIDEIQDLAINQIYLLILVSKHCKVYAGDTCQTISKINRFRFSELSNIFYIFSKIINNYPKVTNAYLCLNYRLNSKILRLSTFMAYLMKILFPNTIDKFQDDFSIKIIEQKPVYINNIDKIIDYIINKGKTDENNIDYTLAANHCFIYNSEGDREELDKLGNEIYKLSIEQSKGLEFELVIVYNFFSSSKFQAIWEKIFSDLKGIKDESIIPSSKLQLNTILCEEDMNYLIETLNLRNIYQDLSNDNIQDKIINELNDFVYPKLNKIFDKHEIFQFCSELKQFYVIITRAKTFLVFYEKNLTKGRDSFYRFMESENINLIERCNNQNELLKSIKKYFNKINLEVKSPHELRLLGNDQFNEGQYSRAMFLYNQAKNDILYTISEIYYNEENLNERINLYNDNSPDLKSLSNKIVENITNIFEKHEKYNLFNIIPKDNNIINIQNILEQLKIILGKNLIYLKRYEEAKALYHKNNMFTEEGLVYLKYEKKYKEAFKIFELRIINMLWIL